MSRNALSLGQQSQWLSMTPPTGGERAWEVYFAAVWLCWRCAPWHSSWQMGDGLLFLKKKQQQTQQMSSAFISMSPSPLAGREMKVFPLEPQPPVWPGLPCEGCQSQTGAVSVLGTRWKKHRSPWVGRGSGRASTSLGCLCSPGAVWLHPATSRPCTSVIRVAGTSRIVTKSQPASHLDQPAALTGILQLHSPYKFLLVLCFLYFAFLNFIFPKGCCGFAACINPKLASCDPRGAGAGASNSERHRWVAGLMPPLLVWLSPPPARPLDYNVAPDAQCPAVKCPSS